MKKVKISDSAPRKYKINECLLKRSIDHHREAIRKIPKYMGISLNTLHNYRNILFNDPQDIPHEIVVLFEQLFLLEPGGLLNKPIKGKTLDELINLKLPQRGKRHMVRTRKIN
jgi:ACT domain-containing protein